MENSNVWVLEKILESCSQIEEAKAAFHKSFDAFYSNSDSRNACCKSVFQIGEMAKALSMDFREKYSVVPWRSWCGIGDIFAYQDESTKINVTWKTMEEDIPILKENVERILKEMKAEA